MNLLFKSTLLLTALALTISVDSFAMKRQDNERPSKKRRTEQPSTHIECSICLNNTSKQNQQVKPYEFFYCSHSNFCLPCIRSHIDLTPDATCPLCRAQQSAKVVIDAVENEDLLKVQDIIAKVPISVINASRDVNGNQALLLAIDKRNAYIINALLAAAGINVSVKDKFGMTALHYAASCKNIGLARTLVEHGANLNVIGCQKNIPLHYVFNGPHVELITPQLIQLCGDSSTVNAQNNTGDTPLHLCIRCSLSLDNIKALIALGANPTIKNKHGKTAFDIAREKVVNISFKQQFTQQLIRLLTEAQSARQ